MQKQLVLRGGCSQKNWQFFARSSSLAAFVRDILTKIYALVPLFSLSFSLPFFFFFEHFSRWQSHNPTGLEHNINSFYVIKCFHLACPIHLMRIPRSRCCSAFHRGRKLRILFCGCAKKNVAEESKIVPAIDIEYLYLFFIFFYVNISLSRLSNSYHYIKFLKTKGKIYL